MKKISPKVYLKIIQKLKDNLKNDRVFKEMCDEYDFDVEDIDLIPVKFDDIDVSARTDKGVIILNWKLLEQKDMLGHLLHETLHHIQQAKEPTQSADDGDYLSNPFEQEAFQFQLKFIDHN